MENKRILVIGGTGYLGKVIVDTLNTKKHQVTILSRNPNTNKIKEGLKYLKGSVLNKEFLLANIKDFDIIIYLAAIIRTLNKAKYKENIVGLKNTLEAMYANKIKKIIHFSTQNIYIKKTGPYGNSKKLCEKMILNSSLDYMIIRPNYVYGIDKQNDFYRLYNIMKKTKICPIIGNGKTKIQPINKKDLAEITIKCLEEWKPKAEINISGKTKLSMNQLSEIIKKKSKIKCITLHIPLWVLKLFKWVITFDVEGYTEDRISPKITTTKKGKSDIKEDIEKIINLDIN